MTKEQKQIHAEFLEFRSRDRAHEIEFIRLLQAAERAGLPRALGCSSLFAYAVDVLDFSEAVSYCYIAVARKSLEFPRLIEGGLSVWKANRIVSTLTPENADSLIEFALDHTSQQIDRECARLNPRSRPEKFKPLGEEFFELHFAASKQFAEKLARVESLRAQRGRQSGRGHAIEEALDCYIEKFDPVAKANRAERRKVRLNAPTKVGDGRNESLGRSELGNVPPGGHVSPGGKVSPAGKVNIQFCEKIAADFLNKVDREIGGNFRLIVGGKGGENEVESETFGEAENDEIQLCSNRVRPRRVPGRRVSLTAAETHAVHLRDGGRCTYTNATGKACGTDRWTAIHHIVHVAQGGSNHPDNLTTLCWFHHDLVHQLGFEMNG